ncbi:MAG: hypothetical protein COB37_01910 [Kordiimonadales bacterium]|nr:MAG: hypothetical protein COB37_01910 [Kordiimonadales bacterium]
MINVRHLKSALLCFSALSLAACSGTNYAASNNAATGQPVNAQANFNRSSGDLRDIATKLAADGNHSAAIPMLRHLSEKSYDPAVLSALANSLLAQGAATEANIILTGLIERGQGSGPIFYAYGKTMLVQGRFSDALSAFDTASTMLPGDAPTASGRAISLAALGRTDEALAAFRSGSDTLTLSNKALVFAATGRAGAAISILEALMRTGQATSRDRQNLAMAYLLGGRENEATRIARIDLDAASIDETFTFYRSLLSLAPKRRMQALVTGTVNPEWTRTDFANLQLSESQDKQVAAKRIVNEPLFAAKKEQAVLLAQAEFPKKAPVVTPKPVAVPPKKQEPKPVPKAEVILTEIPPLLEPEGWALQIGAYRTIRNLMRGWSILYSQSSDLLKDIPPRRSEVVLENKAGGPDGFYYRLNAGPLKTFGQAKDLCTALQARGTSCWIRPPEKTEGTLPSLENIDKGQPSPTITAAAFLP